MKTYNLFISHCWAHSNRYQQLKDLLKGKTYFDFIDYSVPKNDPIHTNGTDKELYNAILRKIKPCSAILIPAGVDATYSKWIEKEIKIAQKEFSTPKPIIAIEPWGSEKTSLLVKNNADEIVKWNTDSIVKAVRKLA